MQASSRKVLDSPFAFVIRLSSRVGVDLMDHITTVDQSHRYGNDNTVWVLLTCRIRSLIGRTRFFTPYRIQPICDPPTHDLVLAAPASSLLVELADTCHRHLYVNFVAGNLPEKDRPSRRSLSKRSLGRLAEGRKRTSQRSQSKFEIFWVFSLPRNGCQFSSKEATWIKPRPRLPVSPCSFPLRLP